MVRASSIILSVGHPTSETHHLVPATNVGWFSCVVGSRHGHDLYLKSPHYLDFMFSEVQIPPSSPPIPMHATKSGHDFRSTISPPVSPPNSKFEPFRRPSGPPTKLPTPAERARARIEAEREKEFEACLAVQEEEERQARIKAEKEELRRQEEEAETRRVAKLEQDIRLAQLLRKQREHDQAKADEKFAQEAEERRRANKEKRLQEHYRSEAWRIEQERNKEQSILRREEDRKRGEEAKMQERKRLFNTMKVEQSGRLQLSGWISVQTAGTVTWRRRWYTFDEKTLRLFKTQNVRSSALLFLFTDGPSRRTHLPWMLLPSPISATSGTAATFRKRNLGSFQILSSLRKSTGTVGPSLPIHRTPWFVSALSLSPLVLTTTRSQERIMAALIFCSDAHKVDPSRRRSNSILSASRIPRLSLGLSS